MGDVKDTELMINYIKKLYPKAFMGAIGISAGRLETCSSSNYHIGRKLIHFIIFQSGQLVSYLAHQSAPFPVQAGVSLCPAYSIKTAFQNLEKQSPLLSKYLLRGMKQMFLKNNEDLLNHYPSFQRALRSESVHEFIVHSSEMAGFDSWEEYLQYSNPMATYHSNKTPCLVVNAVDDPVCLHENIDFSLAETSEHYALVLATCGSHIAFRDGILGNHSWMYRISMDFLQASCDLLTKTPLTANRKTQHIK
jgi:uncharacterized protein